MRKSTLGGVVGPIVFTIVTIVAGAMRPDYLHTQNFISELGATGTANAALMNYAGFVLGGLLIASLGLAMFKLLPRGLSMSLGSVLVGLFGIGVALSGVVSCDLGCPQATGSTANTIHNAIAPLAFLSLIVASVLLGVRWRSDSQLQKIAIYSILTGISGFALLGMLASSLESRELTGLWQRLLLLVLFSWCIIVGLNLGSYEMKQQPS